MTEAAFRKAVSFAVRGLWNGQYSIFNFVDNMYSAIRINYELAWREGALACGIKPEERTDEEKLELARLIGDNLQYVQGFGEYILAHNRASGAKLESLLPRIDAWSSRYLMVQTVAREMACKDQKEKWLRGNTEKPCVDCLRLHGRVYRNSMWAKYGIEPHSPKLACFGVNCDCSRVPTDEPVTPGRPPSLVGPKGGKRKR
jgi:hypothetical protein